MAGPRRPTSRAHRAESQSARSAPDVSAESVTDKVSVAQLKSLAALLDYSGAGQTLSMKQAAKELDCTGQSVRNRLDRLNEAFGMLVEWGGSGQAPRLTWRGRAAEPLVRRMIRTYDDLVGLREADTRELRIGVNRLVLPLVVDVLADGPHGRARLVDDDGRPFDVVLRALDHARQTAQLLDGRLNVAIGYETDEMDEHANYTGPVSDQLFHATTLLSDVKCALVAPPAAFEKGELLHDRLNGLTYLGLPRTRVPKFHADAKKWLARHGVEIGRVVETDQAVEIVATAAIGGGFGFVPRFWREQLGSMAPFVDVPLQLGPKLVVYVERSRVRALSGFVSRLKKRVTERMK